MIGEMKLVYKTKIKAKDRTSVSNSNEVYKNVVKSWENINYEETAKALFLNRRNRVLGILHLSTGGRTSTIIDVGKLCQAGLLCNAESVILLHNHPSGEVDPSQTDINLTKNVKEGLKTIGIRLFDHLIVSEDTYYSFSDEGLI